MFDCLLVVGFKLKVRKCNLFVIEVEYLGYIVFVEGIVIYLDKIKVVKEWEVFLNVLELRLFLGFCSYYRCFVENFVVIVKFFYDLIKKGSLFRWIDDC